MDQTKNFSQGQRNTR